jgi:hypothetical protein
MRICCRWLVAIGSAIGLAFASAIPGHAEPIADVPNPYPDMSLVTAWYDQHQPDEFFLPDRPGVWFLTPSGINCGIWTWGSFGCVGNIPGAGNNHIAWFNGNRAVHYGWTASIGFPAGQAQRPLPPRSYVTYESTTCAVTPEGNTYCVHGEFKLLMTQTETWFKGWDDRRSYVCNSYGSCPPG